MALRTRRNSSATQAQVRTFQITATGGAGTVWTFTLTDDNGNTYAAITYTEDASPTVNEVAAGLAAAWNASLHPQARRATAAASTDTVTITSDTPGRPLPTITLADDATGTHTTTDTTANVGPLDFAAALTWHGNAVPVATDDVEFDANSAGAIYNLDQSGVAIDDLVLGTGFSGQIGRIEDGEVYYYQCDPNSLTIEGGGDLVLIDVGTANISPLINAPGRGQAGRQAVYLKGSNLATLEIRRGKVGVAALEGDTATVATILCTRDEDERGDADLIVGSGTTLTTLTMAGGVCELNAAATTVTVEENATLTTEGTGAITTLNLWGTGHLHSSGTIGTLNLYGTADFTRDNTARTVTTLNLQDGAHLIYDDSVLTIGTLNLPTKGEVKITVT